MARTDPMVEVVREIKARPMPKTRRAIKEEASAVLKAIEALTGRLERLCEWDDTIAEVAYRAFPLDQFDEATVNAAQIFGLEWGDYGVPKRIPATVSVPASIEGGG